MPCFLRDSENDWSLEELSPHSRLFLKTFVVFPDPTDRSWVSEDGLWVFLGVLENFVGGSV